MYNNGNNILLGRRKNNHIIPLNDPKRKLVGKTILFTNARDENNIKECNVYTSKIFSDHAPIYLELTGVK